MLKVLFVNAVDPVSEVESRYPPLWPAYLAAYTERHIGCEKVEFRFMTAEIAAELDSFRPDIVAIGAASQNFNFALHYAGVAREKATAVLVGGPHISALPQCLSRDMDVGCIGEGEQTFLELVRLFLDHGRWDPEHLRSVHGIVYRDNEELVTNPTRGLIPKLDDIPHPKRSIVGYEVDPYIIASRGCPYKCAYCASSRFWSRYRFASAEYVVEEIAELVGHGARVIRFNDDLFVANKHRVRRITELLAQRGLLGKVSFAVSFRANLVSEELVGLLKGMNVVSVTMGLESGCQRTLEYLKANVTVADNERAVNLFKAAKIQANGFFVIGSPTETHDELQETYEFVKRSRVDFFNVYVLTPLPGTPVWDFATQQGIVSDDMDWGRLNMNFEYNAAGAVYVSRTLSPGEIQLWYRKFRRLRLYKILRALPGSPWLRDVPRVALGVIKEEIARLIRRLFRRDPIAPTPKDKVAGRRRPTGSTTSSSS